MKQTLALSEEQGRAVSQAWQEHETRFAAFVAEHKPRKDEFDEALRYRPSTSARSMVLVFESEAHFALIADAQAELDRQFLDSLKPILTEDQLSRWSEFEAQWARHRWADHYAPYVEEGIDLIAIVEELEGNASLHERDDTLSSALCDYLLAYGSALAARADLDIRNFREEYRRDKDQYRIDLENDTS